MGTCFTLGELIPDPWSFPVEKGAWPLGPLPTRTSIPCTRNHEVHPCPAQNPAMAPLPQDTVSEAKVLFVCGAVEASSLLTSAWFSAAQHFSLSKFTGWW